MTHTILCFPASRIQQMLSLYCCRTCSVTVELISSSTAVAIASVSARSAGSPEVQTQRNGPKPSEKISLQEGAKIKTSLWVCVVSTYMCVSLRMVTYPIMCWTYEGYLNSVAPPPFFSTSAPWRDRKTCLLMHFLSWTGLFEVIYAYFDVKRFYYRAHWNTFILTG